MTPRFMAWVLLLAPVGALSAETDVPGDYAFRAPITVARGAPLQRLPLPAAALIRLQQPDYADLRVFDADGRSQPIALLPARAPELARRNTVLTPLPILGAPGSLTVTGLGLRVDASGEARIVRVDGKVAPSTGAAAVLGTLLDTRPAKGPATELALDVDVPRQQPVTFVIEGSADLRRWSWITDHVVYRSPGDPRRVVIPLDTAGVLDRYLRITWRAATPLLAPVAVTAASVATTTAATLPPIVATITGARLIDPRDLRFSLPFATSIAAVRIIPAGDALIPVRILGRNDDEQPWTLLGAGAAYRLTRPGTVDFGPAIALSIQVFRQIKVEADARTAGFAALPNIELVFEPRDIAVLQTGRPPFELAAGRQGARSALLPVSDLMTGTRDTDPATLPVAVVQPSPAIVASTTENAKTVRLTWLLWAVLGAGTLLLAVAAWFAARKPALK